MELDYGTVLITKGKHKGKIAYYDDDDINDLAIVYLKAPFFSAPIRVRKSSLQATTAVNLKMRKFKKENPGICELLGMPD